VDKARFDALLEAYGADARRWPEAERAAAKAFAAEAPAQMRAEGALDRALDLDGAPVDAELFTARMMRGFPAVAAEAAPARKRGGFAASLVALAACAVLGIAIGFGAGHVAPLDAADETLASAFDAYGDGG
jgi:hypothetical protein